MNLMQCRKYGLVTSPDSVFRIFYPPLFSDMHGNGLMLDLCVFCVRGLETIHSSLLWKMLYYN